MALALIAGVVATNPQALIFLAVFGYLVGRVEDTGKILDRWPITDLLIGRMRADQVSPQFSD
jgi:hypothetical protein